MENIFKRAKEKGLTKPQQMKLTEVSKIENLGDAELIHSLKEFYESEIKELRLIAILYNSAATMKRTIFLFSRPIFDALLAKDTQVDRKALSGEEYAAFMAWAYENGFLSVVRPGDSKKGGRASLIEIVDSDFIGWFDIKVGREVRAITKAKFIDLYDNLRSSKSSPLISPIASPLTVSTEPEHEHESVHENELDAPVTSVADAPLDRALDEVRARLLQMNNTQLFQAVIRVGLTQNDLLIEFSGKRLSSREKRMKAIEMILKSGNCGAV
jgi:hypothetical protein